jgi:tRNA (cytidine/uridine-2'-O-)-methyltransferase
LDAFLKDVKPKRLYACTTKGQRSYAAVDYAPGDALLFGPESRGLPAEVLQTLESRQRIRIPMKPHSRSLNLSNAVALILYEAWRQCDYLGGE